MHVDGTFLVILCYYPLEVLPSKTTGMFYAASSGSHRIQMNIFNSVLDWSKANKWRLVSRKQASDSSAKLNCSQYLATAYIFVGIINPAH